MKVLIIQQKMIGDVLTSSLLFELIKKKNPNAILHFVVNEHTVPVVTNNIFINELKIVSPEMEQSVFKLMAFSKSLRVENYDFVIDLYGVYSSNIISLFCGAKEKISKGKWYTKFIYNHLISESRTTASNAGLAIENRLRYLEPLGLKDLNPIKPKIYLTTKEENQTKYFLESKNINLDKPLYMISVLGSDTTKTLPFKYMAEVLDCVVATKPESQLLFNYIPAQVEDARAIFNLCLPETQQHIRLDVFGKSLRDFICITSFCTALIGNEGGAVNMAKAVDVPTFTIFSPWIKKETWSLFENDHTNVSVHLKDFKPEYFEHKATKDLKAAHKMLYELFSPKLYLEQLKTFLK